MRTLILGIGNILLGDEGIGVHCVRYLENQKLPENIDLLDGGTGGFHLLEYFQKYQSIIMIDATMDGSKPGTVNLISPKFSNEFPNVLSSHDIGLKDLIETASLLGTFPKIYLITISIKDFQQMDLSLSKDVAASIPIVSKTVNDLINEIIE